MEDYKIVKNYKLNFNKTSNLISTAFNLIKMVTQEVRKLRTTFLKCYFSIE